MQRQLRRLGLAHDPRRTFATIDPDYVRWTQWIFLQIFDSWYDETRAASRRRRRPGAPDRRAGRGVRLRASARRRTWAGLDEVERRRVLDTHRLAYVSETPGELVPGPGHGAGQRGGHRRRPLRARQLPGVPAQPAAVEHAHHRLRRPPDRRPGAHRLARQGQGDAAQLDRPLRRARASASRSQGGDQVEVFTTRPDTLFGATFVVVAPEHPLLDEVPAAWPDGTKDRVDRRAPHARPTPSRRTAPRPPPRPPSSARPTPAARPACSPATWPRTRSTASCCPCSPPTTCSWATAPARSWPSPAATSATSRSPRRSTCRSSTRSTPPRAPSPARAPATASRSTPSNDEISLDGLGVAEAKAAIIDWLTAQGRRRGHHHLPPARLAVQPPALLGRAVPDRLRRARPAARPSRSRRCR